MTNFDVHHWNGLPNHFQDQDRLIPQKRCLLLVLLPFLLGYAIALLWRSIFIFLVMIASKFDISVIEMVLFNYIHFSALCYL